MGSGGLHRLFDAFVVIVGVGVGLREPHDLLGIHALAVDDSTHLTVASARVKADAAAVEMTTDGRGGRLILRSILQRAGQNLKLLLIDALHKMYVEITQTAVGVSFFDLVADHFATGNDDLVAARHPQQGFGDTLHKAEVLLIVTDVIFVDTGLVCSGVALVSFDRDHDVLTVFFGRLAHLAANNGQRLELGIQFSIDFKLHI